MSVARAAFGIMANEALKHAADARGREDAQSAAMFDEIGMMMLGIAEDVSSPLLDVVNERRQRQKIARNVEFANGRRVKVALAILEMQMTGCTRHAACKRVAALIHKQDGEARSVSGGKELAKHVPLNVQQTSLEPVAADATLLIETTKEALRQKMDQAAEPPLQLIFLALALSYSNWREEHKSREDRASRLRSLFRSAARQSVSTIDMDALGDMLLSVIAKELQPPF